MLVPSKWDRPYSTLPPGIPALPGDEDQWQRQAKVIVERIAIAELTVVVEETAIAGVVQLVIKKIAVIYRSAGVGEGLGLTKVAVPARADAATLGATLNKTVVCLSWVRAIGCIWPQRVGIRVYRIENILAGDVGNSS